MATTRTAANCKRETLQTNQFPLSHTTAFDGNSKELTSKEVGIVRFGEEARYDKVGSDNRNDKKFSKEANGSECENMRILFKKSYF